MSKSLAVSTFMDSQDPVAKLADGVFRFWIELTIKQMSPNVRMPANDGFWPRLALPTVRSRRNPKPIVV